MKKSKKIVVGIIFLALVSVGAKNILGDQVSAQEKELEQALGSGNPVLLYFSSIGCVACIEQEAILDEMESEHAGRVTVIRAGIEDNNEMFKKYAGLVASFPVIVIFDSEGLHLKRYSGLTKKDELERVLSL